MSNLINSIFNLKESIEYSKDSVVSKTIYKGDSIVTLFALDKGQSISEHVTPYDAMVYIIEGSAEIRIGDKTNLLKEGDSIIMPINVPHALDAKESFKMILTMMK